MIEREKNSSFDPIIEIMLSDVLGRIQHFLAHDANEFYSGELKIIRASARAAVVANARRKLNRVFLLELHAAKLEGKLGAGDEWARFSRFIELGSRPEFITHLDQRYPVLRARLERTVMQQVDAIERFSRRLQADRTLLRELVGAEPGRLKALGLGEGDVHNRGEAVFRVDFEHGTVMYKPRSLAIDLAFDQFLIKLFGNGSDRLRVPVSLDRGAYGWAEFVEHSYCAGPAELAEFYRNIGRWLAVMRLVGGTDLHHENIIAARTMPVAVDIESLFALDPPAPASGNGEAVDIATALITGSVLRTGLVPFRAPMLGLHGVDISAAGALQGEQPKIRVPVIEKPGSSEARMQLLDVDLPTAKNHPAERPDISLYWNDVVSGFNALTDHFSALDRAGDLRPALDVFIGCDVRDIRRPTQAYLEVMRMLWHPASLHGEPASVERARRILKINAGVLATAPSDDASILSEIEDMRYGDIPFFTETVCAERVDDCLASWRGMRPELEELTIRGALVTAYLNGRLNDGEGNAHNVVARRPHDAELDLRRRAAAAATVRKLLHLSVRGRSDGTVTWISPILGEEGWTMRSLQSDLYIGVGGVVVALAGYAHEVKMGRADPVDRLDDTIDGVVTVLINLESHEPLDAIGGFIGLGSQLVTWMTLHGLVPQPAFWESALRCAEAIERRNLANETSFDLLEGVSGVIVPLIQLAEISGDKRWLRSAAAAAKRLEAGAIVDAGGARWPSQIFSSPLGGFAHGTTGIGWSLARLALTDAGSSSERERWRALAASAFDFEDSLYRQEDGNWIDVRKPNSKDYPNTWCHGSVGIGLAACDLYARTGEDRYLGTLRRAHGAAISGGWGISHTLCHGDLSLWELLWRSEQADPTLSNQDPVSAAGRILSGIEEYSGAVGGLARDAYTPGLMSGVSGAVHFLNRIHPDCTLPSPLLQEVRHQYARAREDRSDVEFA